MASTKALYSSMSALHSWRPGALRRIPWIGLAAVVGAIIGIAAAVAILVASNGALISDWTYPPTVYLSITYTISNILLNIGLSKGVTINWWRKALMDGTQLGDLHRYWDFGNSVLAAAMAGRRFNFIALACIFVALTPINGPLLQRASSVGIETVYSAVDLEMAATKKIDFFTGYISGRGHNVSLTSEKFNPVVQAFYTNAGIPANNTGCAGTGTCSGRLTGAGFAVDCSSSSVPFNLNQAKLAPNGTDVINWDAVMNGTNVFMSQFFWIPDAPSNLSLEVVFKNTPGCSGDLVVRNCSLRTTTVQYPIVIDGNRSTIALEPSSDIFDDVVVSDIDYPFEDGAQPTYMGGYYFTLHNRFDAISHMRWVGAVGYEIWSSGPTGPQFAQGTGVDIMDSCKITFGDPTAYLLQQARELMFRTAIAGGNSTNIQTIQGGSEVRSAGVYRSHYLFLALAVAITVIAVLIVLGTFNGYWHIGREVTMSPIEIAKAFNAPLLAQENSNDEVKNLVKSAGSKPVRYGAVISWHDAEDNKHGGYVGVAEVEQSQMHLEIADAHVVQPLAH